MSTITIERLRERAREKVKSLEFAVTQTAFVDSRAELVEELELARIALASLEAEPVAYTEKCEITNMQATGLYLRGFPDNSHGRDIALYTAPPAPVSVPDLTALDKLAGEMLNHAINCERRVSVAYTHCAHRLAEEVGDLRAAMLQGAYGNSPVIPDGLRLALSNAGIAAPESDEMLAATLEKYIQTLVTWVKDRKPFRSAVIPDGWVACSEQMPEENAEQEVLACFKGGDISTLYYFEGRWDDAYGIVPIRQDVTHWMPLPSAPQQEVKP